ncbi:MAG: hypothetical protein KKH92_10965 [Firmicutes bacterium]|nr:hypothetical protein [Bacillota bacterium]
MSYEKYISAGSKLRKIDKEKNVLIIHYACEKFGGVSGNDISKIVTIEIFSRESNQTTSFSIHTKAQLLKITVDKIVENYDYIEKLMLDDFYEFVNKNSSNTVWVHWNLRNDVYGFKAIELRYKILGGNPSVLIDSQKYDLGEILKDRYGYNYVDHPRLKNLIEMNKFNDKNFVTGEDEAELFKKQEFEKIHLSCLTKVRGLYNTLEYAIHNKLVTKSKWTYPLGGFSPKAIKEFFQSNWMLAILYFIFTIIIGGVIGYFISKILG